MELLRQQLIDARAFRAEKENLGASSTRAAVYTTYVTVVKLEGNAIEHELIEEIQQLCVALEREDHRHEIQTIFQQIDTDHSGEIDEQEIRLAMKLLLKSEPKNSEIRQILSKYDLNANGKIDIRELELVLMGKCSTPKAADLLFQEPMVIVEPEEDEILPEPPNQAVEMEFEAAVEIIQEPTPLNLSDVYPKNIKRQVLRLQDPLEFSRLDEFDLSNVIALILPGNNIQDVESVLQQMPRMPHLNILDLSRNGVSKLTDRTFDAFPLLEILDLGYNQIQHIGGLRTNFKLRALNLCCNQIRVVKNLEQLRELEILDLSRNSIHSTISLRALSMNKKLKRINLEYNPVVQQRQFRATVMNLIPELHVFNTETLPKGKKELSQGNQKAQPIVDRDTSTWIASTCLRIGLIDTETSEAELQRQKREKRRAQQQRDVSRSRHVPSKVQVPVVETSLVKTPFNSSPKPTYAEQQRCIAKLSTTESSTSPRARSPRLGKQLVKVLDAQETPIVIKKPEPPVIVNEEPSMIEKPPPPARSSISDRLATARQEILSAKGSTARCESEAERQARESRYQVAMERERQREAPIAARDKSPSPEKRYMMHTQSSGIKTGVRPPPIPVPAVDIVPRPPPIPVESESFVHSNSFLGRVQLQDFMIQLREDLATVHTALRVLVRFCRAPEQNETNLMNYRTQLEDMGVLNDPHINENVQDALNRSNQEGNELVVASLTKVRWKSVDPIHLRPSAASRCQAKATRATWIDR